MEISVVDVAGIILHETEFLTTMKLQKLAYYSQAYSLVKFGEPLFNEDFEAWVNGPVSPVLFERHRRKYTVEDGDLGKDVLTDIRKLSEQQQQCITVVIDKLSAFSGKALSELTHSEDPWLVHRKGYALTERSTEVIKKEEMQQYYSSPDIQAEHVLFS